MRKFNLLFLSFASLLIFSCSGSEEGETAKGDSKCKEENNVTITSDTPELKSFEAKNNIAFLGGWQFGDKHRGKVSICIANYDVKLSMFDVELPKEDGQYIIVITFVGDFAPKEEKLPALKTGKFEFGSSSNENPSVSAVVWKKGGTIDAFYNIAQHTGSGELTHIDESSVCGNATIKTPDGTEIQASFNMPIEKDFWKDQR